LGLSRLEVALMPVLVGNGLPLAASYSGPGLRRAVEGCEFRKVPFQCASGAVVVWVSLSARQAVPTRALATRACG
jgi:hypothetical protein